MHYHSSYCMGEYTISPNFQSSLTAQLEYKLPALLSTGRVGVVIIDSIAALFRAEYGAGQAAQRAAVLQTCGARLHHLSASYGVAVVCVNQVLTPLVPQL